MTSPKAPTGRQTIAQGKEPRDAALGSPPQQIQSPVGAGQLPVGWERTTLGEFGDLFCGQSLPATKVNRKGSGVPYVTGPEHWDGQKVHLDKWTDEPARMAPDGCIFITVKGAGVGKLFPGVPCAIGRDIYAYKAASEIPRKFVELSLRFTISQVVSEAKGDIPGLSKSHILDHTIPLPPDAEQHRIVAKIEELFSELDAGEENLRRARRQLGVYRQALLKQAFEGKLTEHWRKQNPHFLESLASDEDIPTEEFERFSELPACWRYTRLDRLIHNIDAGKSFRCEERRPKSNEIGVAKVSAVTWGEYDEAESKTCIDPSKVNPRYFIREGDFLLSRANTIELVGACVIVRRITQPIMLSDKTLRLSIDAERKSFLLQYLRSHQGRREIEMRSTGNQESMRNIGQERIRSIVIPECSLPEQQEIVRILDEQFTAIEQNEREIDAALKRSTALRQSILKKAFTGQLVPQDPTDEPAATLLERIRKEREGLEVASLPRKPSKKRAASPKIPKKFT